MNNKKTSITKNEILLGLIENDIYSGQLIYGLFDKMNIDANDYHLRLSEVVFRILGYGHGLTPQNVSDKYFKLVYEASMNTLGSGWKKVPASATVVLRKMNKFISKLKD